MWIVCITSVRHVLTVNGYGGRQTKENEKSWCFKGWETLVNNIRFMAAFFTSLYSIILVKTKIGEYFPPSFCFSLICYRENPIAGRD